MAGARLLGSAVYWSVSSPNGIRLHPSGLADYLSFTTATNGTQQVGAAHRFGFLTSDTRALLWNGSAASVVDLTPSGYPMAAAYGLSSNQQVGMGVPTGLSSGHALLWNGSATDYVDLNPSGYFSGAFATDGEQQVGSGGRLSDEYAHAKLWQGTAESFVDLTPPAGYISTVAVGVSRGQQVGYSKDDLTSSTDKFRALLWRGTAESCVDLHPLGYWNSWAYGTDGTRQVGAGHRIGSTLHALLWNGSATDYIDLHQFLSTDFSWSRADSIVGDTVYGIAYRDGAYHAVSWTIPEPTAAVAIGAVGVLLSRRQYR